MNIFTNLSKGASKCDKGFFAIRKRIYPKYWFLERLFQKVSCYFRFYHYTGNYYKVNLFAELTKPLLVLAKLAWWFVVFVWLHVVLLELFFSLVVLYFPLAVLVFPLVVLVFPLGVLVCSLVVLVCPPVVSVSSTRSICLSTCSTRRTICWFFYHWSKEEAKNVMFWLKKGVSKVENTLFQWFFQNILESQSFQTVAKLIIANFYGIDFMKGIVILVKIAEMYNILKSASHCLLVKRWDRNGWLKFFLLEICPYVYYVPPLVRISLHLVRDTTAEKEVDIVI